jgi:hypothetical protein
MKWLKIVLVLLGLFSSVGLRDSYADVIPGPAPPKRPADLQNERKESTPLYPIASGVVAVALTISFFALRSIRKRNEK